MTKRKTLDITALDVVTGAPEQTIKTLETMPNICQALESP